MCWLKKHSSHPPLRNLTAARKPVKQSSRSWSSRTYRASQAPVIANPTIATAPASKAYGAWVLTCSMRSDADASDDTIVVSLIGLA